MFHQFLELFNPLPGNQYLLVTTHADAVASVMAEKLSHVGGTLSLECFPGVHEEMLLPNVIRHDIATLQAPFRGLPRSHDLVVFQDIYHCHAYPERLMKLAYTTLANTAELIIMQERGSMNFEAMLIMLEAFEFRAANRIDVLSGYDLVMAKKMHMWGNGL